MALAHLRMLIHEFLNKDPDIVPEEAHLILLDRKYSMCMAKNGKDTKHTRHILSSLTFLSLVATRYPIFRLSPQV